MKKKQNIANISNNVSVNIANNNTHLILGLNEERNILKHAIDLNIPMLIIGDTGTGKTSLVRELANEYGATFRRLNLNGGTTADEFAGRYTLDGKGGMIWVDGVLIDAMRKGYWLLVDEINTASPDVLFFLHSLLDDDRTITLAEKDGEIVTPHKDFRLFATMNDSQEYSGTRELNKAFASRFGVILQTKYPDPATEEKILLQRYNITDEHSALLVKIATDLRKSYKEKQISYICSTRDLLSVARLLNVGVPVIDAIKFALMHRVLPESEEYKTIEDIIKLHVGDLGTGKIASVEGLNKKIEELEEKTQGIDTKFSEVLQSILTMFNLGDLDISTYTIHNFSPEQFKQAITDKALQKLSK